MTKKSSHNNLKRDTKILIILAIVVVFMRIFFVMPIMVEGESMEPTLCEGEVKVAKPTTILSYTPQKNDIVIIKRPSFDAAIIKRVAGVPGETVRVGDKNVVLGDHQIYVLGDNSEKSLDSRDPKLGPVDIKEVIGVLYQFA